MTNALIAADIDKIILTFKEKLPVEQTMLTVKKYKDEYGSERFIYTMDGIGSVILYPDLNDEYQVAEITGDKMIMSVGFNSIVKHFVGKDWPDKQP